MSQPETTKPGPLIDFVQGQPPGGIRPSLKRDLIASVDDPSLSDADFREAVRLALRNPWYE